jgi:hypothetical protein
MYEEGTNGIKVRNKTERNKGAIKKMRDRERHDGCKEQKKKKKKRKKKAGWTCGLDKHRYEKYLGK